MSKSKSEAKAKPAKRKGNRKDRQRPPAASEPASAVSESKPDNSKPDDPDELILAAIIAGGMASGRVVAPASSCRADEIGHGCGYGVDHPFSLKGPMCAIGAGITFAKPKKPFVANALDAFGEIYSVDADYASAVSRGFETGIPLLYTMEQSWRGCSVGNAAYDFFHEPAEVKHASERRIDLGRDYCWWDG